MKHKDEHTTEQILAEKNQLKDIAWALKHRVSSWRAQLAVRAIRTQARKDGLDQVKELTRQTIQRTIQYAPFNSLEDFLTRVDPREQEAVSLARVGALEGLGKIPSILRRLQNGAWQQNQMSLFEWADSSQEDWTLQQKVDAQLDILGVSLAAHPLELVSEKLAGKAQPRT